jgi:hypothetical protein
LLSPVLEKGYDFNPHLADVGWLSEDVAELGSSAGPTDPPPSAAVPPNPRGAYRTVTASEEAREEMR